MKDVKYIVVFLAMGLGLAYVVSVPLRKSKSDSSSVGTSLQKEDVYAEGVIAIAPDLKAKAQKMPALYLIGRSVADGRTVAVKKYDRPSFPLAFSLGPDGHMMGDAEFFDGDIKLIARLDHDGNAGPKQPEDVEGVAVVQKNASRNVTIVIGR